MNVFTRLRAALFGTPAAASAGGLLTGIFPSGQAPRRGTREILRAYRQSPWCRAIVHRIATDIASHQLKVYGRVGGVKEKHISRDAIGGHVASGDLVEIKHHPMVDLLSSWNPALGRLNSVQAAQAYLDLKGESPIVIERGTDGKPMELWPVPPHWLRDTPSNSNPRYAFSFNGWNRDIPESDVLYIRDVDVENPYGRGAGQAEALADELDIDEHAAKHIKSWFYNRAMPDVIVSMEGASEDEAKRFQQQMRDKYQGTGKGFQAHVTGSKIQVETVSQTFKEMDLVNLRAQERDLMLQVFGVPPEVMGIVENSNRATIDAAYYLYAKGVQNPRLARLGDALTPVAKEWDERLLVGCESPVPEDKEFKRTVMASQPGLFTKNEHRALAGAAPREGWDEEFPEAAPAFSSFGGAPAPALKPGDDVEGEVVDEEDEDQERSGAQRGRLLPIGKKLSEANIQAVLAKLQPETLTKRVSPVFEEEIAKWGSAVLGDLNSTVAFDIRNPLVADWMEGFKDVTIVGVNTTTSDSMRKTLLEGVRAGEGISELADRIGHVFDNAEGYRAETIARTEVVGASNAANLTAYSLSGVVAEKEWLAVQDSKTRETHADLDETVIKMDANFITSTGASGPGPGLMNDPAEVINCRCTLLPVVGDGRSLEDRVAKWRAYDAALLPWESAVIRALALGFNEQRRLAIDALEQS